MKAMEKKDQQSKLENNFVFLHRVLNVWCSTKCNTITFTYSMFSRSLKYKSYTMSRKGNLSVESFVYLMFEPFYAFVSSSFYPYGFLMYQFSVPVIEHFCVQE